MQLTRTNVSEEEQEQVGRRKFPECEDSHDVFRAPKTPRSLIISPNEAVFCSHPRGRGSPPREHRGTTTCIFSIPNQLIARLRTRYSRRQSCIAGNSNLAWQNFWSDFDSAEGVKVGSGRAR